MKNYLEILKALGDETRLRIINLLYERELCVCDIEDIVVATQTKISRHLTYLKNSGLVHCRRSAQWSFYSIEKSDELKFLDKLVYDLLRSIDIYKHDITALKKKARTGCCQSGNIKKDK